MSHGIKELKEAIAAVFEIGIAIAEVAKDGIDFGDALELWETIKDDEDSLQMIMDGWRNAIAIREEIKDLDHKEIAELISLVVLYVPEVIDALKK